MNDEPEDAHDPASDEAITAERRAIRKRAMDLLARREHAPAELAAKLRKREHAGTDIAEVLEGLIDDNLLSASRYAHAVVASKSGRGIGPVRIRSELSAVGIDEALAEEALAAADIDWAALAEQVRAKRFGPAVPDDFPTKARQMRFLQRRGFDFAHIQGAFDD